MLKTRHLLSNLILVLLAVNLFGSFVWSFGFHTIRMALVIGSSLGVFLIFMTGSNFRLNIWLKVFVLALFITGLYGSERSDYLTILVQDVCALGIWFSVLMIKPTQKQIYRGSLLLLFVALVFYAYSIPKLSISGFLGGFENREQAFELTSVNSQGGVDMAYVIYMTQTLFIYNLFIFLLLSPFLYHRLGKVKMRVIFLLIAGVILFISVYYQKKQSLLELTLLYLLMSVLYRKLLPGIFPRNLVIGFIVFSITLFTVAQSSYLDSTFKRFNELYENFDKFDRAEESSRAFEDFTIMEFAFGKGLGSVVPNTPGYSVLHIGYSNLVLKGGILFVLLYLSLSVYNLIYCFRMTRTHLIYYVGVLCSIFSMVQLTYTGGYLFYMQLILTGMAMFSRYPLNFYVAQEYMSLNKKQVMLEEQN